MCCTQKQFKLIETILIYGVNVMVNLTSTCMNENFTDSVTANITEEMFPENESCWMEINLKMKEIVFQSS